MLTLSRVMIPWDWIGIVTIRSETFLRVCASGTMKFSPGSRTPTTRPNQKSTPFSYCQTIFTDRARMIRARITSTITVIHVAFMVVFLSLGGPQPLSPSLLGARNPHRGRSPGVGGESLWRAGAPLALHRRTPDRTPFGLRTRPRR